jgi:hypothetical protein
MADIQSAPVIITEMGITEERVSSNLLNTGPTATRFCSKVGKISLDLSLFPLLPAIELAFKLSLHRAVSTMAAMSVRRQRCVRFHP